MTLAYFDETRTLKKITFNTFPKLIDSTAEPNIVLVACSLLPKFCMLHPTRLNCNCIEVDYPFSTEPTLDTSKLTKSLPRVAKVWNLRISIKTESKY